MSESSNSDIPTNIYDEVLNNETICDLSFKQFVDIPELNNKLISVLYLQNNAIATLPEDFFPSLPNLMWLDMRSNALTEIPTSVKNHPSLTHLLLQDNHLTSLPNELGTVHLKVLQVHGNPLNYPPKVVIDSGVKKTLAFLHNKYMDYIFAQTHSDTSENASANGLYTDLIREAVSYNSVIDGSGPKRNKPLSVQFSGKDLGGAEVCYGKTKGKCPKLAKSRNKLPTYCQSSKYVRPPSADSKEMMNYKMKQSYLKELALKKHKDLLAIRDTTLQARKNFEILRNWRKNYCYRQQFANGSYKMDSKRFPYDTSPDYMTLLTREDLERDLPDKYRKRLIRKSRPTVPRKANNEVHLALKIKQLFDNLEAIDLSGQGLTPRTEQRMLLSEIQKITEIKQKLSELSLTNGRSAAAD